LLNNHAARAWMARADELPSFNASVWKSGRRLVVRGGGGGLRELAGTAD
jgi:hypothetical protein